MPIYKKTKIITLTSGGGTENLPTNSYHNYYIINGVSDLTSNWTIQPSGDVKLGMEYTFKYEAEIALNNNTITIFGTTLPSLLADKTHEITAYYNGTKWEVNFKIDINENGTIPANIISNYKEHDKYAVISVPISFENNEMGFQIVPIPFINGFKLHSIFPTITKNMDNTDDGVIKIYPYNDVKNPYSFTSSTQIIFQGTVDNLLGEHLFTNMNHSLEFTGKGLIKIETSKTTPGGKGMLYITVIKN